MALQPSSTSWQTRRSCPCPNGKIEIWNSTKLIFPSRKEVHGGCLLIKWRSDTFSQHVKINNGRHLKNYYLLKKSERKEPRRTCTSFTSRSCLCIWVVTATTNDKNNAKIHFRFEKNGNFWHYFFGLSIISLASGHNSSITCNRQKWLFIQWCATVFHS